MTRFRLLRRAVTLAGALAVAAMVAATSFAAPSPTGKTGQGRSILAGTKPAWTIAATATPVAATDVVRAKVWLAPRNDAQLTALAKAVSDPSGAQHGQFLTAGQYRAQFAPSAAQLSAVTGWLTQSGLTVGSIGPDNHYVAVSGTASAVNNAFGTLLGKYGVNGGQAQAPTTDLSVPANLAGVVQSVTGLITLGHTMQPADLGAPPAFVNGTPCSDYYGQKLASDLPPFQGQTLPYAVCGYTPAQLRGTYGIPSTGVSLLGHNSTVAIVDAFDASTLGLDAATYAARRGDPGYAAGQFQDRSVPEDVSKAVACGGNGWYGEQSLDVEAVHAMAPGATVLYYGAASCFDDDLLASLSQIVHDNDASIVSNSWGEPTFVRVNGQIFTTLDPTLVRAYNSVFHQGAAEGIGFYFSSGDSGDELAANGVKAPDFPTEDPFVTSVGGTSVAIDAQNSRIFETGWGTAKWILANNAWSLLVPFLYGSGGGFTDLHGQPYLGQPWYQNGVVPRPKDDVRGVPDIALDGDPTTGMLIGETQSFPLDSRFGPAGVHYGEFRIGGTSLSCPLLAGLQATAQAKGRRIGFANPLIYALAGTPAYYDVTPQGDPGNVRADYANGINPDAGLLYSVRTFDQDSSLETRPGWDPVTGVGAPTAQYLSAVSANH